MIVTREQETDREQILQLLNGFAGASEEILSHLSLSSHLITPEIRNDYTHLNNVMAEYHEWREHLPSAQRGSALTPVVAILTVFSVGAALIAQSGLLHAVLARLAQVQ